MITLTNADNALKSFYLDAVVSAIDTKKVQDNVAE